MIIGIAGASRSGKTTLAKHISEYLQPKSCRIIKQDDFALPKAKLPRINGELDWEHPAGIDFEKLINTITDSSAEFTIVEGFLLFYHEELVQIIDKKIFIEIDRSTFLDRKKEDSRWGDVTQDYIDHVWSSYLRFGIPESTDIDLLIPGTKVKHQVPIIIREINTYEKNAH